MKASWLTAAAVVAASIVGTCPARADDVDPVVYWNQVLTANVTGSPVLTSRTYSMVDVAIFEAANATTGNTRLSYLGLAQTGGNTSAAVARAARDVMLNVLPPAAVAQRNDVETKYLAAIAAIPDSPAKTAGINAGALAATTVINLRASDGFNAVSPYIPTNLPGHWQPTTPGALPVSPQWGGVTPWGIDSGSQFRPGPPPAWNSPEFAAALAEVQAIGDVNSATRTPFERDSALYWASAGGTGLAPWIRAAIGAADGKGLSTLDYASMFASLTTNVADTTIGLFDAKYTYDFWRPVTASLYFDSASTFSPLINPVPSHPSYVSGHSGIAAAASESLAFYLGSDTDVCFTGFNCFDSFALAADNAANSRLWGGIHYQFDNDAGLALGRQVAQFNLAQGLFQSVPEPSTWAMMLAGFGAIGFAMRRRRRQAVRYDFT